MNVFETNTQPQLSVELVVMVTVESKKCPMEIELFFGKKHSIVVTENVDVITSDISFISYCLKIKRIVCYQDTSIQQIAIMCWFIKQS